MYWVAFSILALFSVVGVVLTLLTLPGPWLILSVALLCKWWQPELLPWWAIGAAAALAVLGEVIEFLASSVGASRAGGSRSSMVGAGVGGLIGAVVGTLFIPVPLVGTLVGAALGAALGAMAAERGVARQTWKHSARVASGAARGRLLAVVGKTAAAVVMALLLIVAAVAF